MYIDDTPEGFGRLGHDTTECACGCGSFLANKQVIFKDGWYIEGHRNIYSKLWLKELQKVPGLPIKR